MIKVLIVEDDLMMADQIEEILGAAGFDVCGIASTATEAALLTEQHHPDVGVFDFNLADGEYGTDVATTLRQHSSMGVLYATGNPNHHRLSHAVGDGCLAKPYSASALVTSLKIVVGRMQGSPDLPPFPRGFRILARQDAVALT